MLPFLWVSLWGPKGKGALRTVRRCICLQQFVTGHWPSAVIQKQPSLSKYMFEISFTNNTGKRTFGSPQPFSWKIPEMKVTGPLLMCTIQLFISGSLWSLSCLRGLEDRFCLIMVREDQWWTCKLSVQMGNGPAGWSWIEWQRGSNLWN